MKADPEHLNTDDNAILALIDPLDLIPDDIVVIDFPDYKTQQVDDVKLDASDLLEFDF